MTNEYYEWDDGWFTYYINVESGEKKLYLEEGDTLLPYYDKIDDFCWKIEKD